MRSFYSEYKRRQKIRKMYVCLFWLFAIAAIVWFVLSFGFDFNYISNAWLSLVAAFVCESRQQAAKGWLTGANIVIALRRGRDGSLKDPFMTDPSQEVLYNGATEEMNWRAHA